MPSYIPAKLAKSQADGTGVLDFDTDTFLMLIVQAGTGIPSTSKTGIQFVSDITATNTEVSGTGYARQTLVGLTIAFDGTLTNAVDWSFTTASFAQNAAGFTNGRYIVICKDGVNDAARRVCLIGDPGVTLSSVAGQIDVASPTGGAIQWTVP